MLSSCSRASAARSGSWASAVSRRWPRPEHVDAAERAQLARRQVEAAEVRGREPGVEAAAQGGVDSRRLLEDLLAHEVVIAAPVVVIRAPTDGGGRLGGRPGIERG